MHGYSLFSETICGGVVPIERSESGDWVVYQTKTEALYEVTDDFLEYQRQFNVGERSFDDAMVTEWLIKRVESFPDGSIMDGEGRLFARET